MGAKGALRARVDKGTHDKLCEDFQTPEQPKMSLRISCPRSVKELAESHALSLLVFSCVVLNGVQMGLQTDYSGPEWSSLFTVLDHTFTFVFTFEMIVKIVAYRKAYFDQKWNIFDCILTSLS